MHHSGTGLAELHTDFLKGLLVLSDFMAGNGVWMLGEEREGAQLSGIGWRWIKTNMYTP